MNTGVYQIKNKVNGNSYIGSSSFSLYFRLKHHKNALDRDEHCNTHLQRAWNKYGKENFEFSILEAALPETCLIREQWYLNNFPCEYNICKIAGSPLGRKFSKETKKKLSDAKIGALNPMFGKIGKLNRESKTVICVNNSGESLEFESIKAVSSFFKIKYSTLSMILNKRNLSSRILKKMGLSMYFKEEVY